MKHKLLFLSLCVMPVLAQTTVEVDFAQPRDQHLSKTKIGLYQTPLTSADWLERDIPKLSELEARNMRYEIAWGKGGCFGYEMVSRSDGNLKYDFSAVDLFTGLVSKEHTNLLMCHSYTPRVAGMKWMGAPTDFAVYKEVNKEFAKHWVDLGLQNHYVEVWNEPDLTGVFFDGTLGDYLQIYQYATEGIMEGNPDAKIGGPAGAFSNWFTPLLQKCEEKGWPLHFLSGHNYGDPTGQLASMRSALVQAGRPDVELVLTEFAPYNTGNGETHAGGLVERYEAAMTFFDAIETFLAYPDLTFVNWAQYIDAGVNGRTLAAGTGDKMGLIDGDNGYRKALFNAFKIYGMMPVDRYVLTSASASIKGLASADPNNAGVVIWNTGEEEESLKLDIANLPFAEGTVELYRIDAEHSWYETGDDGFDRLEEFEITDPSFAWEGTVPGKSVVFLKFADGSGLTEMKDNPFAYVIKTHHWFFERDKSVYADFDAKTWITRLGMGDERFGDAVIGVYADDVPKSFRVKYVFSGLEPEVKDNNSTVNFRMDYQNTNGEFSKSVLFHGGLYNDRRDSKITWGTKNHADEVVQVDLENFEVETARYAPADWNGKVIFTYQMQNVGLNVRAKVQMEALERGNSHVAGVAKKSLTISPNPCNDRLAIELPDGAGQVDVLLTSLSGSAVKHLSGIARGTFCTLDMSDVPAGSYILQARQGGKVHAAAVIKCAD